MDQHELNALKRWFTDYCGSFYSLNREDQRNIALKEEHTRNVCGNIVQIARTLSLDEARIKLAEAIALYHDIGRFPQYHRFKTFKDSVSINHAALGAKVLIENNVLQGLPKHEQDIIVRAVALHNVHSIPGGLDQDLLLFLKLVRDADKLDIWRVAIEYYGQPEDGRASAVGLGLPDVPGYSPEVLTALKNEQMVQMSTLKTLNDFKLLQLAWIYDLNFASSLRIVESRQYIDGIAATLPRTGKIGEALATVRGYVHKGLQNK
ncbi:MAG TPA: HD domain-containing protein [Nitrospirota bacterium]|nr:HD domain-containing protein [Nitrospirota bacterium]